MEIRSGWLQRSRIAAQRCQRHLSSFAEEVLPEVCHPSWCEINTSNSAAQLSYYAVFRQKCSVATGRPGEPTGCISAQVCTVTRPRSQPFRRRVPQPPAVRTALRRTVPHHARAASVPADPRHDLTGCRNSPELADSLMRSRRLPMLFAVALHRRTLQTWPARETGLTRYSTSSSS